MRRTHVNRRQNRLNMRSAILGYLRLRPAFRAVCALLNDEAHATECRSRDLITGAGPFKFEKRLAMDGPIIGNCITDATLARKLVCTRLCSSLPALYSYESLCDKWFRCDALGIKTRLFESVSQKGEHE